MFNLNEARKFAGLPQIKEAKVDVMFNNHEDEKANLEKAGITLSNPRKGGGGNTEVTLSGNEKAIRKYLAKLWDMDTDAEEIDELFEGTFVGSDKAVQGPFSKAEAVKACKALIEEGTSFSVKVHAADAKGALAGKIYVSPK